MGEVGSDDALETTVLFEQALDRTVGEVMVRRPKTHPPDASVADVRRAFERPNVRTALLANGELFVGAVERDGVPTGAADDEPASRYLVATPVTVTPGMSMREAVELLDGRDEPRLIVLDEDGVTLRGLVCVNSRSTGFCVR